MSQQNKNSHGEQSDVRTAAAVAAAKADPQPAADAVPKTDYPKRAHVRSKTGGDFVHLYTNDKITTEGKKIDLDHFAISQIEAGKWEMFDPNAD